MLFNNHPSSNSRLVIFDKSLELERVFSDAYPEEACITIAPHQNTFSIISQKLANKTFDELHIVAHGSAGKIYLGDVIDRFALIANAEDISGWNINNIFLWSCETGASSDFISTFRELSGAQIFSSSEKLGQGKILDESDFYQLNQIINDSSQTLIFGDIGNAFKDAGNAISGAAQDVGNAIGGAAEDAGNAIVDGVEDAANFVSEAAQAAAAAAQRVGEHTLDIAEDIRAVEIGPLAPSFFFADQLSALLLTQNIDLNANSSVTNRGQINYYIDDNEFGFLAPLVNLSGVPLRDVDWHPVLARSDGQYNFTVTSTPSGSFNPSLAIYNVGGAIGKAFLDNPVVEVGASAYSTVMGSIGWDSGEVQEGLAGLQAPLVSADGVNGTASISLSNATGFGVIETEAGAIGLNPFSSGGAFNAGDLKGTLVFLEVGSADGNTGYYKIDANRNYLARIISSVDENHTEDDTSTGSTSFIGNVTVIDDDFGDDEFSEATSSSDLITTSGRDVGEIFTTGYGSSRSVYVRDEDFNTLGRDEVARGSLAFVSKDGTASLNQTISIEGLNDQVDITSIPLSLNVLDPAFNGSLLASFLLSFYVSDPDVVDNILYYKLASGGLIDQAGDLATAFGERTGDIDYVELRKIATLDNVLTEFYRITVADGPAVDGQRNTSDSKDFSVTVVPANADNVMNVESDEYHHISTSFFST